MKSVGTTGSTTCPVFPISLTRLLDNLLLYLAILRCAEPIPSRSEPQPATGRSGFRAGSLLVRLRLAAFYHSPTGP